MRPVFDAITCRWIWWCKRCGHVEQTESRRTARFHEEMHRKHAHA